MSLIESELENETLSSLKWIVDDWIEFNDTLQKKMKGEIPLPFNPVETLVTNYLKKQSLVLDVGCKTGKNAACLLRHGHKVVLLDVAPNAILYSKENLIREGLGEGIVGTLNMKINELSNEYGSFDAVVVTYAFSFVLPDQFEEVMIKNVLNRILKNGFFIGGFFGSEHDWANYEKLTIVDVERLEALFSSAGFSLLLMEEEIKDTTTVKEGVVQFHSINVIAQKL